MESVDLVVSQKVYQCNASHVQSDGGTFLQVYNEGTPEFDQSGVGDIATELPFHQAMEKWMGTQAEFDKNRGNLQVNFGGAGGQCCQKRTQDSISRNFGGAMPADRVGTNDPLVQTIMEFGAALGRIAKLPWADNDQWRRRLEVSVHPKFGEGVLHEHGSCVFGLVPGCQVIHHCDQENCNELPNVITASAILPRRGFPGE